MVNATESIETFFYNFTYVMDSSTRKALALRKVVGSLLVAQLRIDIRKYVRIHLGVPNNITDLLRGIKIERIRIRFL